MATINDLKNHIDKLVSNGKGEQKLKIMYDGFIYDIDDVSKLFEEHREHKFGVCGGEVFPGDITISTN